MIRVHLTELRVPMKRHAWIACVLLCAVGFRQNKSKGKLGPDLSGSWPTTMTRTVLEDAGLFHHDDVVESGTRTSRLGSEPERLSNHMLVWHQLYAVTFELRTGLTVSAIAEIDYSPLADMNMGPRVYVISKVLQPEGKPEPAKNPGSVQ
jgi:hypothetical protein